MKTKFQTRKHELSVFLAEDIDADGLLSPVFPVKFQLWGFVPLTTKKWGYKEKNRGTKQN